MDWLRRGLFGIAEKGAEKSPIERPTDDENGSEAEDQIWKVSIAEGGERGADVAFVHGLDGDLRTTWKAGAAGEVYFPSLLGEDLPGAAVSSIGYDVSSFAWRGHTMPLVDRAINILALLDANGFGNRPVVFVAHSLGGLLVKQMLRHATSYGNPAWLKIAEQTKGVAFLSTPHAGSELATWLQHIHLLLPTVSMQELEAHQSNLRDLNLWYRNAVSGGTLKIENLVLYEKRLTNGLLVVNPTSADPGIPGVIPIPIDADHISICKPISKSALQYKLVKRFVAKLVGADGAVVRTDASASSVRPSLTESPVQDPTTFRPTSPVQIVFEDAPEYPLLNLSIVNLTPNPVQITAVRVVKAASVKDHHERIEHLTGPRLRLDFSLKDSKTGQWIRAFGEQQVSRLGGLEAEAFQLSLECENTLSVVDLDVEYVSATGSGCAFSESVALVHAPFADRSAGGLITVVERSTALDALLNRIENAIYSREPYKKCAALEPALLRSAACFCRDQPSLGWRKLKERFDGDKLFGIIVTSFAELGARVRLSDEVKKELELWVHQPEKLGSIPTWDDEALSAVFLDAVLRLK